MSLRNAKCVAEKARTQSDFGRNLERVVKAATYDVRCHRKRINHAMR
jgi:hypothetical protein